MRKISLLVSKNCFGNCEGCYLDPRSGNELSLKDFSKLAQSLKNAKYEGITLSGGDPLIRKDILDIIDIFYSLGFDIHLDTTGTPLLQKDFRKEFLRAQIHKKISLIGIPYDGSSQKILEAFRTNWVNMKAETDEILHILNNNNFNISINTVVHAGNLRDLNNIYKIITKYHNVNRWELHQFVSLSARSKSIENDLTISKETFQRVVEGIDNNKGIQISPKSSDRKCNFKYIDFNGDLVFLKERERKVLQNLMGLNTVELTTLLEDL